jgi:hypothetical protein
MPRFHFNVYDGVDAPDCDGTELPDWDTAREEAIRLSGELLRDSAKQMALGEDWRMEVTDETGLILFRLDFTVMGSSALPGLKPKSD